MRTGIAIKGLSLLLAALALAGCQQAAPAGGDAMEKRIADLEGQIGAAQEQNRDLRAKARAAHVFGRSPLGDFFARPEFWQCTYDSSWSDCAGRCSTQTSQGYKACLDKYPEGPGRVKCVDDNTTRGANCLRGCPVQTSPLDPPSCRGGGGGPLT